MAVAERPTSAELNVADRQSDLQIERMVAEIGAIISSADANKRGELKEFAETLLRDEIASIPEQSAVAPKGSAEKRFNPLFPGILLTVFGLGFFFLFPLVGIALGVIGLALVVWGVILSGLRS